MEAFKISQAAAERHRSLCASDEACDRRLFLAPICFWGLCSPISRWIFPFSLSFFTRCCVVLHWIFHWDTIADLWQSASAELSLSDQLWHVGSQLCPEFTSYLGECAVHHTVLWVLYTSGLCHRLEIGGRSIHQVDGFHGGHIHSQQQSHDLRHARDTCAELR